MIRGPESLRNTETLQLLKIKQKGDLIQFGQVFKAKLSRNGEKTTVAVKTLRNNPERIEVENLISELKIMIHLGSHENIVNVIGACTKRLPDQELYVLVEYCEHGNILDVLRRHKASFR